MDSKGKSLLIVLCLESANAIAGLVSIPVEFHGNWATTKADCTGIGIETYGVADPGVKIEKNKLHRIEETCDLRLVKTSAKNQFSGQFICNDYGTKSKIAFAWSLSESGRLMGFPDGKASNPKMIRCSKL